VFFFDTSTLNYAALLTMLLTTSMGLFTPHNLNP